MITTCRIEYHHGIREDKDKPNEGWFWEIKNNSIIIESQKLYKTKKGAKESAKKIANKLNLKIDAVTVFN